jgi:hypothetical protein
MYPSYPRHSRHTPLSIQFAVPSRGIANRILEDSIDHELLRIRAAANVLLPQIDCLARLLSRHRIQIEEISPNQLGVTLFLPPPPCPAPMSKMFSKFRRVLLRRPRLDTIAEEASSQDAQIQGNGNTELAIEDWITLYKYVPTGQRCT